MKKKIYSKNTGKVNATITALRVLMPFLPEAPPGEGSFDMFSHLLMDWGFFQISPYGADKTRRSSESYRQKQGYSLRKSIVFERGIPYSAVWAA